MDFDSIISKIVAWWTSGVSPSLKNINSKQKHNRAGAQSKIIHKFQVPQSMGFNESHSAVENVVVITGKLISLPYGLKAGLNSESHYQQFYFLLLLLSTPPPACLCLFFFPLLSLSFNLIFPFSHMILPPCPPSLSPHHIFKTFDIKPSVVLRSNCNDQSGSWHRLPMLTHLARKKTKGALTPCELTVSRCPSSVVARLKE